MAPYDSVLLMCGLSSCNRARPLVAHHGTASALAQAMGQDRKAVASMLLYVAAIPMAFFNAPVAMGL